MAHIIIIGAGIGGLPMVFVMREMARPEDSVTVLANTKTFHFPCCSGLPGTGSSRDLECICLADCGSTGAAFVALPQIQPRNVNWFSHGHWVHAAKIAFEKDFMHKLKKGTSEPVCEKYVMKALGIMKLKEKQK